MKNRVSIVVIGVFAFIATGCNNANKPMKYPYTKQVDTVDVYFGHEVADPYRWLEDDNSAETKAWVIAENRVTNSYLKRIPFRKKVKERLSEIWNYPRVSAPWKEGGMYFFTKNNGLQNHSVYYKMATLESNPEIIIDPNKLSKDGTVALSAFSVSKDGKYLGYGISRGGSDWSEFFVRDMKTGEDLSDHLKWIKFSGIAWYKNGFFYTRYPEPAKGKELVGANLNSKVYYHQIGANQADDKLI
jgi:prolyl oligopeptidase